MDRFERVNLKTHLGLLSDLSPIPKSAYGCCRYYTVIESFTETDQAKCTRKSLLIPKSSHVLLQLGPWPNRQWGRLFSIMVNSQHGQDGKAFQGWNSSSLHLQTELPSWLGPKERLNPDKTPEGVFSPSSAHPPPQNQTSWPKWLRQKGQGICFSLIHLFLCQIITYMPILTCTYGMYVYCIIMRTAN